MKLLHISDLHLGKRINDFSMIEDQKFILAKIEEIVERERPDAILIAGDIYDRSIPSTEAMEVFERFLCHLSDGGNQVFVISGNHDSAERLSFGRALMEGSGIHIAPAYGSAAAGANAEGTTHFALQDQYGTVDLYLLPFVKPANVRHALVRSGRMSEDEAAGIDTYAKALAAAIAAMDIPAKAAEDSTRRSVMVAHQFVTGAATCESEDVIVGGLDNIDADVFDAFDYVALGHLHGPQALGPKRNIRYSGTPLKYSFSELAHQKSVTIVELGAKGDAGAEETGGAELEIRTIPLEPLREWADLRGTFEQVTNEAFLKKTDTDAYTRITLLDEDDVPEAIARLKTYYPNLMNLRYDNKRTQAENDLSDGGELKQRSEIELLEELFEKQNNAEMSQRQKDLAKGILETIKEEWE